MTFSKDPFAEATEPVVIADGPMAVGGHQAYSVLPEGYLGVCEVVDGDDKILAVAPRDVAFSIASYAISPDGGCTSATVQPAPGARVTHTDLLDWML